MALIIVFCLFSLIFVASSVYTDPNTTYLVRVGRTSSNWSSGNSNLHHHRASANSKLRELCQMQTTGSVVNGFESTSSFSALPLQPIPRGGSGGERSCPMERAFFMSGPIKRGALSGPLEPPTRSDSGANNVPFSAPLGGVYVKKKRRRGISGIRKALYRNFPEKKRPWVLPVMNFGGGRKEDPPAPNCGGRESEMSCDNIFSGL